MPAKTNLLDRGLGSQFNIAIIAAMLSLLVALVTSMITTRIATDNALKELRRDQERQAILRLEIAQLKEIDATIAVVAGGLPAKFVVQGGRPFRTPTLIVWFTIYQRNANVMRHATPWRTLG